MKSIVTVGFFLFFIVFVLLFYGHVDQFYQWMAIVSASSFVGAAIGNALGEMDLRAREERRQKLESSYWL